MGGGVERVTRYSRSFIKEEAMALYNRKRVSKNEVQTRATVVDISSPPRVRVCVCACACACACVCACSCAFKWRLEK